MIGRFGDQCCWILPLVNDVSSGRFSENNLSSYGFRHMIRRFGGGGDLSRSELGLGCGLGCKSMIEVFLSRVWVMIAIFILFFEDRCTRRNGFPKLFPQHLASTLSSSLSEWIEDGADELVFIEEHSIDWPHCHRLITILSFWLKTVNCLS